MIETFLATVSPMLIMFVCMLIGFALRKCNLLPSDAAAVMSKLESYVFVPALSFHTFMTYCNINSIKENYNFVLFSVVGLAISLLMAIPLSYFFIKRGGDYYSRNIYKYALTFGNFGFMGNAIVPAILGGVYGGDVLYKYMLFTLPLNLMVYSWGVILMIPKSDNKSGVLKNLVNPIFIAIVLGALCGITGLTDKLPALVTTTVGYFKDCMTPVAMLLTGFVIGGYSLKDMFCNKKIYLATALRLILQPTVIIAVLILLKAPPLVTLMALFAYATPMGINTVIFPSAYGGDASTGASMATVSHTIGTLTIPLMYAFVSMIL